MVVAFVATDDPWRLRLIDDIPGTMVVGLLHLEQCNLMDVVSGTMTGGCCT